MRSRTLILVGTGFILSALAPPLARGQSSPPRPLAPQANTANVSISKPGPSKAPPPRAIPFVGVDHPLDPALRNAAMSSAVYQLSAGKQTQPSTPNSPPIASYTPDVNTGGMYVELYQPYAATLGAIHSWPTFPFLATEQLALVVYWPDTRAAAYFFMDCALGVTQGVQNVLAHYRLAMGGTLFDAQTTQLTSGHLIFGFRSADTTNPNDRARMFLWMSGSGQGWWNFGTCRLYAI